MATGFVQRYKGKIECDSLWVRGFPTGGALSSTGSTALTPVGVNTLVSSSLRSVYQLAGLPPPGVEAYFVLQPTTGISIKAPTGTNFGVYGGTTAIVIASTVNMNISLLGVSSVQAVISSVWSTAATVVNATLSTTT